MTRWTTSVFVGWLGVVASFAQAQPAPRGGARTAEGGPKGEAKLRWICHRLGLDEQQKQQVESMIAVYQAELADLKSDVDGLRERMKGKFSEIQDARQRGDDAAVARLQEEMKLLMPEAAAERSFFEALDGILTPKQKERLEIVKQRVGSAQDVSMRPYHVLKVALDFGLTREQINRLETVLDAYRGDVQKNRPADQADRDLRVEKLVESIRGILTPDQVTQYDEKIAALRLDAPPPQRLDIAGPGAPGGPKGARPALIKPTRVGQPAPARKAPPASEEDEENRE